MKITEGHRRLAARRAKGGFALVFALLLTIPAAAFAWDEPDYFRGVPWGASTDEAKKILEQIDPACVPGTYCGTGTTVGPVPTHLGPIFRENKFVAVDLTFRSDDYKVTRSIFVERYGEPTARKVEEFKTKDDLSATNETLIWAGQRVTVQLQLYVERIDESRGQILLNEEIARRKAYDEKVTKKARKDL